METYAKEFLTLALVHFLAVIAPGPDFAITIRQSVRFGRTIGIITALGIGAGISLHVGYTLLGISALLHTYSWLLTTTSLIGAVYLAYLGISLVQSQPSKSISETTDNEALPAEALDQKILYRKAFLLGFLTNATNPKATLFFLAIFTTIVQPNTPLPIQAFYGAWMCFINASWFAVVAAIFTTSKVRRAFLSIGYWFERAMGLIMLAIALRLAVQIMH